MPAAIVDEFTDQPISRQRKLQLRRIRDGLCKICGEKRGNYSALCDKHAFKARLDARQKSESREWQPGGKGRKPKDADV